MGIEWNSELPDGRKVVIRRRGEDWLVRCGDSRARSDDLEVALARAILADTDVVAHGLDPANGQQTPARKRKAAGDF